jgi:Protein of unknown function (DUF2958)
MSNTHCDTGTPVTWSGTYEQALKVVQPFMSRRQYRRMLLLAFGEEGQFFIQRMCELAQTISTMPKTYQTETKGMTPTVYLHYFLGGADWFIYEKDGHGTGTKQAFGLADLFLDGGELGYISIEELVSTGIGAELDLHWIAQPLEAVRAKREMTLI